MATGSNIDTKCHFNAFLRKSAIIIKKLECKNINWFGDCLLFLGEMLSRSISDLVLIYVCYFHHHFQWSLFKFDHYWDTRASIFDPCIQGNSFFWFWAHFAFSKGKRLPESITKLAQPSNSMPRAFWYGRKASWE